MNLKFEMFMMYFMSYPYFMMCLVTYVLSYVL